MKLYKYSGAGNDFVVLDGRAGHCDAAELEHYRDASAISALCDRGSGFRAADGRVGADGLMILGQEPGFDFRMEFYNPDGSSGMMCGNGGRCIVAFADFLGLVPSEGKIFRFIAADGVHTGEILSRDGGLWEVRLGMIDCLEYGPALDGWFLNTGTRHFVKFLDCGEALESLDIDAEGPRYRHDPAFAPVGANANFVSVLPDGRLKVRTFEKGVEAETLACGTGLTACALASWLRVREKGVETELDSLQIAFEKGADTETLTPLPRARESRDAGADLAECSCPAVHVDLRARIAEPAVHVDLRARIAEPAVHVDLRARIADLAVEFVPPCRPGAAFSDVFLIGPAELIG